MSGGKDKVSLQTRIDDLADDVLVGEANDKAVLRRIAEGEIIQVLTEMLLNSTYYLFFAWVTSLLRA